MKCLLFALLLHAIAFFGAACDFVPSSVCPLSGSYWNVSVVKLTPSTSAQVKFLTGLCKDSCRCHLWDTSPLSLHETFTYILSADALASVYSKDFPPSGIVVETEDLGPILDAAPKQVATYTSNAVSKQESKFVLDDGFYHNFYSLDALYEKWRALERIYSPNVSMESFGKSVEGRPIYLLRVGKTDEKEPRRLLLNALQHAREWVTVPTATFVVEMLATRMAMGEHGLPSNIQVLVVPVSNPDGYAYTASNDRLWRKNRRPGDPCFGIDLNRNWDIDYGGPFSTSRDPCSNEFVGTAPFSEPETSALRDLIENNAGIRAHVDLHAYGQDVLGAWEYSSTPPPHAHLIDQVGHAMTRAISNARSNEYYFSRGASDTLLYPASGFMSDWTYSQGIMSFTIEVRPLSGDNLVAGFLSSVADIPPTCDEIFAGISNFLEYVKLAPANLSTVSTDVPIIALPGGYSGPTSKAFFKTLLENPIKSLLAVGLAVAIFAAGLFLFSPARVSRQQNSSAEKSRLLS